MFALQVRIYDDQEWDKHMQLEFMDYLVSLCYQIISKFSVMCMCIIIYKSKKPVGGNDGQRPICLDNDTQEPFFNKQ